MSEDYIVGYKFAPVMRSEFKGMQVASSSTCPITGICCSGSGGRRDVISPQAKVLLETDRFSQQMLKLRVQEIGIGNLKDEN